MGTMIGRFPWSFALGVEVDGMVEASTTPFLDADKDSELLARSGEPSLCSIEAGIFGSEFSEQIKKEHVK